MLSKSRQHMASADGVYVCSPSLGHGFGDMVSVALPSVSPHMLTAAAAATMSTLFKPPGHILF